MRGSRRFSGALVALAVATTTVAGCTTTPDGQPIGDCRTAPVDLGPASKVADVSADGSLIAAITYADDGSSTIDLIHRLTGARQTILATTPLGDGAEVWMSDDGARVLLLRSEPGLAPYVLHDVASGQKVPVDASITSHVAVSDDALRVVERTTSGWAIAHVVTGARTPLGMTAPAGTAVVAFSPDLSRAVRSTSGNATYRHVEVLDTVTGSVVRDLGSVHSESAGYLDVRFLDDDTLLFDDAVPASAPTDAVADDGAFLVDVPSGAVTRLDPGIPGAHTSHSTTDGRRSVTSTWSPARSWLRSDGVNTPLGDLWFGWTTDRDLTVLVRADDGRVVVRCV